MDTLGRQPMEPFHQPPADPFAGLSQQQHHLLEESIGLVIEKARERIVDGGWLSTEDMESHWWRFIKPLAFLLRRANKLHQAADTPVGVSKKFAPFHLLPLYKPRQACVQFNTSNLYNLYKMARLTTEITTGTQQFFEQRRATVDRQWSLGFRLEKMKGADRSLNYSIMTDGVRCSVSVRVIKPNADVNEHGYYYQPIQGQRYKQLNIDQRSRVVGLDPGRHDVFAIAWGEDLRFPMGKRIDIFPSTELCLILSK
jgi:hypothetical protein